MSRFSVWLTMLLIGFSASAAATGEQKMDMAMDMKMMDANGDGMISKKEFMKFHEMMFDRMKKNKAGMIDVKEMGMMHEDMQMMHRGEGPHKEGTPNNDKKAK